MELRVGDVVVSSDDAGALEPILQALADTFKDNWLDEAVDETGALQPVTVTIDGVEYSVRVEKLQ
jgi:hypothetical protein